MTIEIIRPETDTLIQQCLHSGQFRDIDDLLTSAIGALQKNRSEAFTQCLQVKAGKDERPRQRTLSSLKRQSSVPECPCKARKNNFHGSFLKPSEYAGR